MSDPGPTRRQTDLADMVELLLDKGVVVNADIAVTVGETELLGVKVRAAVASFETAAKYGMEFPEGTDMDRVERAAGVEPLDDRPGEQAELTELDIRESDDEAESAEEDDADEATAETGDGDRADD